MTIDSIILLVVIIGALFIYLRDIWRTRKGNVKFNSPNTMKQKKRDENNYFFDCDDD